MTETKAFKDGSIQIIIPLPPITKKNHQQICWKNSSRGKKIPFVRPSAQYSQYEKNCAVFLKPLGIDQPVNVAAKFYMPTKRRVDLTNLNEALHDILVMIFARNPVYVPIMVEPYSISLLLSPNFESMAVFLQAVKPMASDHAQRIQNH